MPELLHPERVASDSIRGYLFQTVATVAQWLKLGPNEILLCEGDEDIDKLLVDEAGVVRELHQVQLKDLAQPASARSQPVQESIFNFLQSFVHHTRSGRKVRFTFRTTARMAKQQTGTKTGTKARLLLDNDVLQTWRTLGAHNDPEATRQLLIRDLKQLARSQAPDPSATDNKTTRERKRATKDALEESIAFMDDWPQRWDGFLQSVEWEFEAHSLDAARGLVVAHLADDDRTKHLPSEPLLARLLLWVLEASSRKQPKDRVLTADDLGVISTVTRKELQEWLDEHNAQSIFDIEARLDEVEAQLEALRNELLFSWKELTGLAKEWRSDIAADIAGVICLVRSDLINAAREIDAGCQILLGESGDGKSSIASRLLAHRPTPQVVLRGQQLADFEQSRKPSVSKLIQESEDHAGTLLVDSVEQVGGDEDLAALRSVLRAAFERGWRVILTCRTEDWPAVEKSIWRVLPHDQAVAVSTVPPLDDDDRHVVVGAVPQLARIANAKPSPPFVSSPKILDLLARGAIVGSLGDASRWLGDADVIAWLLGEHLVFHGDRGPALLALTLARREGDAGTDGVDLTELVVDSAHLAFLEERQVINVRGGHAKFAHDLYADFARAWWLAEHMGDEIGVVLCERRRQRRWRRALVLAFQVTLDRQPISEIASTWRRLLTALQRDSGGQASGADNLLDATWACARPSQTLEAVTPELLATEVGLARRLLRRFRYQASAPHPVITRESLKAGRPPSLELAARFRVPQELVSWMAVVDWLFNNRSALIAHAAQEVFEVLETWLVLRSKAVPLRREAASILLDLTDPERWPRYERGREGVRLFQLLLAVGHSGLVDDVRFEATCRRLAGLVPAHPVAVDPEPEGMSRLPAYLTKSMFPREPVGPWPDGPVEHPDDDFAEAALTEPGATFLTERDPRFANTIFLALLINPPGERDIDCLYERDGELRNSQATQPTRQFAPLLALLATEPLAGLKFATRVLDFATDRWQEMWARGGERDHPPDINAITLEVGGELRECFGDARVFAWNLAHHGPPAATAVAMTLEQWLTQQKLHDQLSEQHLEALLLGSRSVATLGILVDLLLLSPELIVSTLEPLGTSPELVYFLRPRQLELRSKYTFGPEDHGHLQFDLVQLCVQYWLVRGQEWPLLERARDRQAARLATIVDEDILDAVEAWIEQFDRANWTLRPDGSAEYRPPESLRRRWEKKQQVAALGLDILELPSRCQQLCEAGSVDSADALKLFRYGQGLGEIPEDIADLMGGLRGVRAIIAATLLVAGQSWLGERDAARDECLAWLLSPLEGAPPRFGSRVDAHDGTWDVFCAIALPRLLADNPEDRRLRAAMARLVIYPHDVKTRRLYAEARRHLPPSQFETLLHLGIRVARFISLESAAEFSRASTVVLSAHLNRVLQMYVEKRLGPPPTGWRNRLHRWMPLRTPGRVRRDWRGDGFDEAFLWCVFAWLEEEAQRGEELDAAMVTELAEGLRQRLEGPARPRLSIWGRFKAWWVRLAQNLRRPQQKSLPRVRESWRPEGPFDQDSAIVELIARLILAESRPVDRRAVWEPWLSLPRESDSWLAMLFDSLYRQGTREDEGRLGDLLDELLSYGETVGWLSGARCGSRTLELTRSAFGLPRFGADTIWSEARASLASRLAPHVQYLVEQRPGGSWSVELAADLCCRPAWANVRPQALAWFDECLDEIEIDEEDEVGRALVGLLGAVVDGAEAGSLPTESQAHFESILARLESKQLSSALALARRLASS